uniref:Uncharacterized protein n=1 Tax=Caenorhabditis tropicalis TaxID=1561998 RepID=A0A1I7T8N6_9PELO
MSSIVEVPEAGSRASELMAMDQINDIFTKYLENTSLPLEMLEEDEIENMALRSLVMGSTRESAKKLLKKIGEMKEERKKREKMMARKRKNSDESSSGYSSGESKKTKTAPRVPRAPKKKIVPAVPPANEELGDDPLVEMRKIMKKHNEKMRLQKTE